jgi:hypothetical protein
MRGSIPRGHSSIRREGGIPRPHVERVQYQDNVTNLTLLLTAALAPELPVA